MTAIQAFLHQRHTRAAVAIWAIVPTVFLFFAITLAVDPATHLDRLRVGVVVLDEGVATPDGPVSVGQHMLAGVGERLGAQPVPYATEAGLSDAILARDVNLGIVVPAGLTETVLAGTPAQLEVVRTDANDPFVNGFSANLASQLTASLGAMLPTFAAGGTPTPPAVTVGTTTVAPTTDFRFPALPGTLLLPLWMATVAFGALLATSGDRVRAELGALRAGLAELAVAGVAAGLVAAVIAVDIALFSWRADLELLGLFGFLWIGLLASAWLVIGSIRFAGFALGVVLAITALFIQQPVSGAAFPASFAPDVVAWAEPIAPLRYLVEGVRNLLIGGTTTPEMAAALGLLAIAGATLAVAGMARLTFMEREAVGRETLATA